MFTAKSCTTGSADASEGVRNVQPLLLAGDRSFTRRRNVSRRYNVCIFRRSLRRNVSPYIHPGKPIMVHRFVPLVALAAICASPAAAQSIVAAPIIVPTIPVAPAPVVVQQPAWVAPAAPVVVNRPVITAGPAPVVVNRPAVTAYPNTVTSYSAPVALPPTVTAYSAPVTAYSAPPTGYVAPVVTPPVVAVPAPVLVGPHYVPGQPVRNFLRAVAQ